MLGNHENKKKPRNTYVGFGFHIWVHCFSYIFYRPIGIFKDWYDVMLVSFKISKIWLICFDSDLNLLIQWSRYCGDDELNHSFAVLDASVKGCCVGELAKES